MSLKVHSMTLVQLCYVVKIKFNHIEMDTKLVKLISWINLIEINKTKMNIIILFIFILNTQLYHDLTCLLFDFVVTFYTTLNSNKIALCVTYLTLSWEFYLFFIVWLGMFIVHGILFLQESVEYRSCTWFIAICLY